MNFMLKYNPAGMVTCGNSVPVNLLVANVSATNNKRLASGFSYWIYVKWENDVPLSQHIANAVFLELRSSELPADILSAGASRSVDTALAQARKTRSTHVVLISEVSSSMFYAGYLIIPLVSLVSYEVYYQVELYDLSTDKRIFIKEYEVDGLTLKGWKPILLDSVYDFLWVPSWIYEIYNEKMIGHTVYKVVGDICQNIKVVQ